ncbi:hypothetical protein M408DRAFT_62054 [Serendipita vermifera MAFF 305830]|uniref:Uncharacterized protein n=1 Tax=Serendipita vermifera MAFF 305830 TaxID=933852 RepID=A0A0C3B890_SERVB|nr:hypothetical protein M408DRAFT_62054 [Serendipita vermifera MAFF 305830]
MSKPDGALKERRLKDYKYLMEYQTRWNDNDQYAHLNNSVYNLLFDTIINKYLIEKCDLRPSDTGPSALAQPIALVIESHATFLRPLSFPSRIVLGMRVLKLGKSSVTYEVGVFGPLKEGNQRPAVVGGFTHVFVERDTRRPIKSMSSAVLEGLGGVLANDAPVPTRL